MHAVEKRQEITCYKMLWAGHGGLVDKACSLSVVRC